MKVDFKLPILTLVFLCLGWGSALAAPISGTLEKGYRVLDLELGGENEFVVYRGDYVKFRLPAGVSSARVQFPELGHDKNVLSDLDATPFIKMKKAGLFAFSVDSIQGRIRVVEYQRSGYQAVGAAQAMELILGISPLVLDVRTPREFNAGHLDGAMLIPVQQLHRRKGELAGHEESPILIYCATGNRSVVASKILIDSGFKEIINMKGGIADWRRNGYAVVK
ncbi:MAG: rhodanese-like domain-containing protein [Desulfobacterales bacterium]|nr:rhodanese-like domain-containing protein [Desulfobacterales bacterium]